MLLTDVFGWAAFGLIPITAIVAWLMRRFGHGSVVACFRPHFVLGYAALVFAFMHLFTVFGAMGGDNGLGIRLAIVALAIQALLGINLQGPGSYRRPLRRWHFAIFIFALTLASGHVMLNA